MYLNRRITVGVCIILLACKSNTNPYVNNLNISPAELVEMDTAHYVNIHWQDAIYDFGAINAGDSIHIQYGFTNTGNTPLFIFNTHRTCGCTITDFPKEPVLPGKSGLTAVAFKSGTQLGKIEKAIFVIANTKGSKCNPLILRGMVQPPAGQNQ
jgi:hypothetical protein